MNVSEFSPFAPLIWLHFAKIKFIFMKIIFYCANETNSLNVNKIVGILWDRFKSFSFARVHCKDGWWSVHIYFRRHLWLFTSDLLRQNQKLEVPKMLEYKKNNTANTVVTPGNWTITELPAKFSAV